MRATQHVHEVDKRNRVMQVGWCACGETWDERQGAWVGAKYFDGIRRRAHWLNNQGREG